MERTMEMYGGKNYGVAVSVYGLDKGYLDYRTLACVVGDLILNNRLMTFEEFYGVYVYDVYQTYIISEKGYDFLSRNTDEIVYYCEELDIYLWGITHFGTSWDYVLTNIKLKEMM